MEFLNKAISREQMPIQGVSARLLGRDELKILQEFDNLATFSGNDTPIDHAPPPLTLRELTQAYDQGDILGGVFDDNQNMVGYFWFEQKIESLYVSSIAVHPNLRDNHLGRYFLKLADVTAEACGYTKCSLSVDPLNGRGVNAYLQHGYKIVGFEKGYFGLEYPNTHRFIMEKEIMPCRLDLVGLVKIISCSNETSIHNAIIDGYMGICMIRDKNFDNRLNKILFVQ